MIRVEQIKLAVGYSQDDMQKALMKALGVRLDQVKDYCIIKKSIDSRDKRQIKYVMSFAVQLNDEKRYLAKHSNAKVYEAPIRSINGVLPDNIPMPSKRPVVVGLGPAGLFAALTLAKAGLRPIIFERGKSVDEREKSVANFIETHALDTQSNLQFGEGGAGTFSDGKLNTGTNSSLISAVFGEFVEFGAPQQILYDSKPHIGTDKLRVVVKKMREKIVALGGEVYFDSQVTNIRTASSKIIGLDISTKDRGLWSIDCDCCILAIGHSARDTFEMLAQKTLMEQKPFSVGVRIEHLQKSIDRAQYGDVKGLPAANYSLSCHLDNGRSCYTFCMCPGGYVMPATSEECAVVTNGMSYFARDGINANSALLVGVTPQDFKSSNPLAGVEFQRKYERLAYGISQSYKAPCQRLEDLQLGRASDGFGEIKPTYPIGVTPVDLRACLPDYVADSIVQAANVFDKKLKGFADRDALLTGVESRSSSPVRILRNEKGDSSIEGLMPCGEGAGYAGGITSASVDGINIALKYVSKLLLS